MAEEQEKNQAVDETRTEEEKAYPEKDVQAKIAEHEKILQELTGQAQKLNDQLTQVLELRKQRIGAIAGLRDLIGANAQQPKQN